MPLLVPSEQQVAEASLQLPGAVALGDNGLGAVAQGASAAAQEFRAQQMEIERRVNAAKVLAARREVSQAWADQRSRERDNQGIAARGAPARVDSWWESEPAKIEATLDNSAQRDMFHEYVESQRAASYSEFSDFEQRETTAGLVNEAEATIDVGIEHAIAGHDNPEALALARAEVDDGLATLALFDPRQQSEAARERARLAAYTKLHQQTIENMIDADPARALEYYNRFLPEIAPSARDALKARIDSGADIRVAQQAADDIWARGLSETEALTAARKEVEGSDREHTLALLRQQYAEQEAAIAEADKARLEAIRSTQLEGGYSALTPAQVDFMQRKSPGELERMRSTSPQDQVPTNWDVYDGLLELSRKERTLFLDVDLQQHIHELNLRQLDELSKIQADMAAGRASPTATLTQIIDEIEFDDREQKGRFSNAVREAILLEQHTTGAPPSEIRMRELTREQLTNIRIPRWYWTDRDVPTFELVQEQVQNIPEAERAIISDALRRRGLPATDAAVLRLYNAGQQQGAE